MAAALKILRDILPLKILLSPLSPHFKGQMQNLLQTFHDINSLPQINITSSKWVYSSNVPEVFIDTDRCITRDPDTSVCLFLALPYFDSYFGGTLAPYHEKSKSMDVFNEMEM